MEDDIIKEYQHKIQEIKDEIAKTNNELKLQNSDQEFERLKIIHDLCEEDISNLNSELKQLKDKNNALSEEISTLKKKNSYKETESEVKLRIKNLEQDNKEIIKPYESSFSIERMISNETDRKTLNETFVLLQKKLGTIEVSNAELTKKIKKSEIEVKNLRKKCESASGRCKSNEELKEKIKSLETALEKSNQIEISLKNELKEAENCLLSEKTRPENMVDTRAAEKLVNYALESLQQEKNRLAELQAKLKEKKKDLDEISTFGVQSNKITVKLNEELSLVELVLKEKKAYSEKLDKDIQEYEDKYHLLKQENLINNSRL